MSLEAVPSIETPEQIKLRLQEKYRAILGQQLTLTDINKFIEEIITELVELTGEVTESYAKEKGLKLEENSGKNFEDEAFFHYGLEKVSDLLDKAQEKLEIAQEVSGFVAQNINVVHLEEVITPPEKTKDSLVPGNGGEFAPNMIPRLETALFILREGGVPLENITLMDGIVTPRMLRQTSYVTVVIPEINRLIQVCDEEGNVSYIFKLSSVNVDTINRMTKPEKNELIANHPGIGIRFRQSSHWREIVESYLFDEIPADDGSDETEGGSYGQEVLVPQYGELDSWRGFAVDEQGRHWGTRPYLAKKLGRSYSTLTQKKQDPRVEIRSIFDVQGRVQPGYCLEQLLGLFPELLTERRVEKDGEWQGFWIDSETGKHWSTAFGLQQKFGVKAWQTIKQYAQAHNLPTISVTDMRGHYGDANCYEDFLAIDSFMELVTMPKVESEGKWVGYWIDSSGKHWAHTGTLASHFETQDSTLKKFIEWAQLPQIFLRSRAGDPSPAFCLEDLEADQQLKDFINIPRVENGTEWAGFWTDEKDRHWGTRRQIAKKCGTNEFAIKRIEVRHPDLRSQMIKTAMGRPRKSFCYEDIVEIMNSAK